MDIFFFFLLKVFLYAANVCFNYFFLKIPESDMSVNFPRLTCEGSSSRPVLMNWREMLFSVDKKK